VDVAGMFFFEDNTFILRKGDPTGDRLAKFANEKGILLLMCDQCALQRKLASGAPRNARADGTVDGVEVGCFPGLYKALAPAEVDQLLML